MKSPLILLAAGVVCASVAGFAGSATARTVASPRTATTIAIPRDELPVSAPRARRAIRHEGVKAALTIAAPELTRVVKTACANCHSDKRMAGNLSLESYDVAKATQRPEATEGIILKLQAGMMPPPGSKRPADDTLMALATTLERQLDAAAALKPEPGSRMFQRLNQVEYQRSIRAILDLDVDPGKWLPLDTKSANFDNVADVQLPSATTFDAYLDAASEISRMAIGDAHASKTSISYNVPRLASQWTRAEGAPLGTRGGVSVMHNFPADGEYTFTVKLHAIPTGQLFGSTAPFDEKIEVSVNGVRVALIDVDRGMSEADVNGMDLRTVAIPVRAGPQRITAAFLQTIDGPLNDLVAPLGHSIADTQIGSQNGVTVFAHLRDLIVTGPFNPTGVSDTPSRRKVFVCRPTTKVEQRPCAEKIMQAIGTAAYRRPLLAKDIQPLMTFYDEGAKEGGFEMGVRTALEAILASPHFMFRMEEVPNGTKPGEKANLSDLDLASRLSFFIWGTPPDDALLAVAKRGGLSTPAGLRAQTLRMLADRRSEAISTRFASQWLRLQDIDKVHPDANQYPDFHGQLADAMRRETELFFNSIVRENRSILDLYRADYTFVNEALAKHYGFNGVTGSHFQRIKYPDNRRAGLLGQASVLTLTSHANRTSPVLRGKWVMEVLLGSPPPPPPPDVPDLEDTKGEKEGRLLTTRERMEIHRANPACRSCHLFMDPIGLALDNFDVMGQWRTRENNVDLDTHGTYYDGSSVSSPAELQKALLNRPTPLIRTFTLNLMAYALGRRIEYFDQPALRRIVRDAEPGGYNFADFVLGIVRSDAFRSTRVTAASDAGSGSFDSK